jgi:N-acetylmuramoyl-L-alanine amidase
VRSPVFSRFISLTSAGILTACAGHGTPTPAAAPTPANNTAPLAPLPAPTQANGPLQIKVVYPKEASRAVSGDTQFVYASPAEPIASRDSAFIFGSVGRGNTQLTVNGTPVPVFPTGTWLAWLPLPDDTLARFDIIARSGTDSAREFFVAHLPRRFHPPPTGLWIDSTSFNPAGSRWMRSGEEFRLSVRASQGSLVRVKLPDGRIIPLVPDSGPGELPWGELAFGTTTPASQLPAKPERFVGRWSGAFGPDPGPVMAPLNLPQPPDTSAWAVVEAINGPDTLRHRWPLRVGVVNMLHPQAVVVNDDTANTGKTDSSLAGRPAPDATYDWFFPNSTIVAVSGRQNGQVRLQLSHATVAWVDGVDIQPLSPDVPPSSAIVNSPRLLPNEKSVILRVPVTAHVPFRVDETEHSLALRIYSAVADMDWIRYTGTDPFVRLISFAQPAEDEVVLTVDLTQDVWGYRTRWDGNNLLLEIRRPPAIDRDNPLKGRKIAIDAGHPPAGATGPSGVHEAQVVLAIARMAKGMLDQAGAQGILIRNSDAPLELVPRLRVVDSTNAEVLVSIHANALPDGVNPFVNSGTSVYYFHPRSAPLARALDRSLVHQFGFKDLGMGRGDLALARPTWMPSALTEGLFIMVPDQEYWLNNPEGQRRYARGLVDGIEAFLKERSRTQ